MDLKLSHLTHLNILPSLTACLVLSTWSGHGLVVSPHTGHKGAKLTALSPAAMDDEATCADASDAGEVVWGMRSGQVRYSGALSTANPFRGDFQIIGRNPAMITAVAFLPASSALARTGAADVPLAAAASADGSICVYDSRTADTVWVLDESARLLDQDGILLRISHLCATSCSVCIGSQRGTVCSIAFNQQMTSLDTESSSAVLHLEALSDTEALFALVGESGIWHSNISGGATRRQNYKLSTSTDITVVKTVFKRSREASEELGVRDVVAAGCADGSVAMWFYSSVTNGQEVFPVRMLHAGDAGLRVTALEIANFAVFAGRYVSHGVCQPRLIRYSLDGSIRVYDPVSGHLLRALNERSSPRHAMRLVEQGMADERRYQVSCLKSPSHGNAIYATIGERVFAWAILADNTATKGQSESNVQV
jgi:WD40 repeat protein